MGKPLNREDMIDALEMQLRSWNNAFTLLLPVSRSDKLLLTWLLFWMPKTRHSWPTWLFSSTLKKTSIRRGTVKEGAYMWASVGCLWLEASGAERHCGLLGKTLSRIVRLRHSTHWKGGLLVDWGFTLKKVTEKCKKGHNCNEVLVRIIVGSRRNITKTFIF